MRPLSFLALASVIGLSYAALSTPIHQPFPALAAERAPAQAATAAPAPMDADDGELPARSTRDALNNQEAEARVLVLCDLISPDDYQANAEADARRRIAIGETSLARLAEDREYIAGMQSVIGRHSCPDVAATAWARNWRPLR